MASNKLFMSVDGRLMELLVKLELAVAWRRYRMIRWMIGGSTLTARLIQRPWTFYCMRTVSLGNIQKRDRGWGTGSERRYGLAIDLLIREHREIPNLSSNNGIKTSTSRPQRGKVGERELRVETSCSPNRPNHVPQNTNKCTV